MRTLYSIILIVFLAPEVAFAQIPASLIPFGGIVGVCDFTTGDVGFNCVPVYIAWVIQFLLSMAGGFLMFGIMIAGYKYILGSLTGQGKDSANKEIIARILGFSVIVLSYLIVDTIIAALTM